MPVLKFQESTRASDTPVAAKPKTAKRRLPVVRRRARKVVEVTHRWVSFTLGIALLAVVLSGVVLTFGPEILQWENGSKFDAQPTDDPISVEEVASIVEAEKANFQPQDIVLNDNVYAVYDLDYTRQAFVDPGSGEYLGIAHSDRGFMGLMRNIHFCALSCEEYPGHVGFLDDPVKTSILGTNLGNPGLTWGGLILGVLGLMLIFLSLGGIWLWWPSIKRFARGFKVRRGNRYKFHYDLHKVVGIVAIPFLLMWGVTGAGFELKQVESVWYALTPGDHPEGKEFDALESDPKEKRSFEPEARDGKVTPTEAQAIGQRVAGDDATFVSVLAASGKTGTHSLYFADNSDPYEYGNFPGDLGIAVDRYSGRSVINYPANVDAPIGEKLWEEWNYPVHAGFFANPGWRIFWGVFGVAVLLLAVTSIITWWIRTAKRRRKGKLASQKLQAEAATPEGT